jgi:hypothetical protein
MSTQFWGSLSSGMGHYAVLQVLTNIQEEPGTYIFCVSPTLKIQSAMSSDYETIRQHIPDERPQISLKKTQGIRDRE